jgi:hypothetical protein
MTASQTLNVADFDEIKQAFKDYLKTQNQYLDVDFEGSNISAILNVLAYNTSIDAFYYNMALNESFIDSALLRPSAISLAKQLNYTPQSFSSAAAVVNITVKSTDKTRGVLVIPKGTYFASKVGSSQMIFTNDSAIMSSLTSYDPTTNLVTFSFSNVSLFQGIYLSESFVYTGIPITISNQQVDTTSITVTGIEDNGKTITSYQFQKAITDLTNADRAFFVEGTPEEKYQISFGNDVHGKAPKINSTITVDYRISDGELPNGASIFIPLQTIDGETNITLETVQKAAGGSVFETTESIKFNAPKFFQTRGNAITANDYTILLKNAFPEVVYASASGGETLQTPMYGKVIVSVACNDVTTLPSARKMQYKKFLDERNSLSIDSVIIDPRRIRIAIETFINVSKTTNTSKEQLITIVNDTINTFGQELTQNAGDLRSSRLTSRIDDSHMSIVSNITNLRVVLKPTATEWLRSTTFEFGVSLSPNFKSTSVIWKGITGILQDSNGIVSFVSGDTTQTVGTINYVSGIVTLPTWKPDNVSLVTVLSCSPASPDIIPAPGTLVTVDSAIVTVL